ncbi:MAG: glutathione synthase [Candidatus Cloacimonetes bacterium]|nr:glutathione synthase [Candidatus Cloacimonadota bacterium]
MKIAFLIDPLASLNPKKDTSLSFMDFASRNGHEVYVFTANDLYIETEVRANIQQVTIDLSQEPFYKIVSSENKDISFLDAIFIRKDPPVNDAYNNMLQILSVLEDQSDVFVINPSVSLLKANEKIYGTRFAKYGPKTRITASYDVALDFIKSQDGKCIIKPVNDCGSSGVYLVDKDDPNLRPLLEQGLEQDNYVIVQEFLDTVYQGDKRIFFLEGEVVGGIKRIPQDGEFRCAMGLGAKVELATLADEELELAQELSEIFKKDDLFFVGIDLIGSKLIEVNVTSPTGVQQYNKLSNEILEEKIFQKLEERVKKNRSRSVR